MTRNAGWALGINLIDTAYVINAKSNKLVRRGMTFSVCVGFQGVPLGEKSAERPSLSKGGTFSCMIADTVVVTADGATLLTEFKREYNDIHYTLDEDDEDDEEDEEEDDDDEDEVVVVRGGRRTRSSTKTKKQIAEEKKAAKLEVEIAESQKRLMEKRAKEAAKNRGDGDKNEEVDEEDTKIVKAF